MLKDSSGGRCQATETHMHTPLVQNTCVGVGVYIYIGPEHKFVVFLSEFQW